MVEGRVRAIEVIKLAVKLAVAADASLSCPAGGSLAKDSQGVACAQAMCSGCEVEMTAVCPGVSISYNIY